MHKVLIVSMCLLLQACSSPVENTNYYLLHTASTDKVKKINPRAPKIVLGKIQLADYLRQDSLVLQLSEHQLFYSPKNIWAEPLQIAIAKALLFDLNQHSNDYQYINHSSAQPEAASYELIVHIEHFLATDKSKVMATGKYWLLNRQSGEQLVVDTFYLQQGLNKDGYTHAVEQLRTLILALSQEIKRGVDVLGQQT